MKNANPARRPLSSSSSAPAGLVAKRVFDLRAVELIEGLRGVPSPNCSACILTINAGRPSLCEHEYKIDRLLLAHKHHAQIHPRGDQANFVTDPFGNERGL